MDDAIYNYISECEIKFIAKLMNWTKQRPINSSRNKWNFAMSTERNLRILELQKNNI